MEDDLSLGCLLLWQARYYVMKTHSILIACKGYFRTYSSNPFISYHNNYLEQSLGQNTMTVLVHSSTH